MMLGASGGWLWGAVLSEDRADLMSHYSEGGGVEVSGPALLARKSFKDTFSFYGGYYADSISSASIDVVTSASPYSDQRDEYTVGVDYLRGDTLMNLSYTASEEDDYQAGTVDAGFSQEMFGGMTTLSMGFSQGSDTVSRVDTDFEDAIDRYGYRLGLAQVLTPTLLLSVDYEGITEDGFLNNPYRSARLLGASVPEAYPRTRTSNAVAVRTRKYWEPGAASRVDYRYFWDTWAVQAHTLEVGYERYFGNEWLMDLFYRHYNQSAASFYSDNFEEEQNYMARDKELSTFQSNALGGKLSYKFLRRPRAGLTSGSLNLSYEFIHFDYDDFTDVRTDEPYSFGAHVLQFYLTVQY